MGLRLLIPIIVIVLVIWLVRRQLSRPAATPPRHSEDMLRCAHCGLHVPATEAIVADDGSYCSTAHRDAGPGN